MQPFMGCLQNQSIYLARKKEWILWSSSRRRTKVDQSSHASFLKLLRAITNIIAITLISYHFDCSSLALSSLMLAWRVTSSGQKSQAIRWLLLLHTDKASSRQEGRHFSDWPQLSREHRPYHRVQEHRKNVKWMDCCSQEKKQAPRFQSFFTVDNN